VYPSTRVWEQEPKVEDLLQQEVQIQHTISPGWKVNEEHLNHLQIESQSSVRGRVSILTVSAEGTTLDGLVEIHIMARKNIGANDEILGQRSFTLPSGQHAHIIDLTYVGLTGTSFTRRYV
jgi:hypothetical protein